MAAAGGGVGAFVAELMKIPPVTRFLCGSLVAVTVPVLMGFVSPMPFIFVGEYVIKRGQLWRIYTSFFYGGGLFFNFLFDMVMLYRNSDQLESTTYAGRSAVYGWQLLLTSVLILGLNLPFHSFVHFRALLVATAYLSSRINPHVMVSLFGLLSFQNQYFPYVMVAMDFVSGGGYRAAIGAFTGLIAGHVWWIMTGAERGAEAASALATPPAWWRRVVFGDYGTRGGAPSGGVPFGRDSGVRVFPARDQQAGTSTGYNWGRGQTLGRSKR